MRIITENLKQRRLELGYSVADVAAALDIKDYVYERYEDENSRKRINPKFITKLAQVLQCDPSVFMDWTIEAPEKPKVQHQQSTLTLHDGRTYQISNLPKEAQDELAHYIEYLTEKYNANADK